MNVMDRKLLRDFVEAYFICFISLVGLFIIIDLFANIDEFLENRPDTLNLARLIGKYYFFHSFEYFAKISPFITSIAAMTTLANLHRNNEIIALLAAGIPTRRALMTILVGVFGVVLLRALVTETIIPQIAPILQRLPENIDGQIGVIPNQDMGRDQILIKSDSANLIEHTIEHVSITLPQHVAGKLQEVNCAKARYEQDPLTQKWGWLLINPSPIQVLTPTEKIRFTGNETNDVYLFCSVTFFDLVKRSQWYDHTSVTELIEQVSSEEAKDPQRLRIVIHKRIMQPFTDFLLVLLGVPFVLQWERKNLYSSIVVSMALSFTLMLFSGAIEYIAKFGWIDPELAAWAPILVFAPLALSLMHRIGT